MRLFQSEEHKSTCGVRIQRFRARGHSNGRISSWSRLIAAAVQLRITRAWVSKPMRYVTRRKSLTVVPLHYKTELFIHAPEDMVVGAMATGATVVSDVSLIPAFLDAVNLSSSPIFRLKRRHE
jgi:hypothetical protein